MIQLLTGTAWALGVLAVCDGLTAFGAARALRLLERVLAPARRAGRDGLAPGAGERRRVALTAAVALCAAGWLVGGVGGALVCGLAGPPAVFSVVAARRRRWRNAVGVQAPAAARAIAAALASGSALPRALALAARDGALAPSGRALLAETVTSIDLGARTDDALSLLADRAGPGPWPALVAALLVQREAGGDLPRLLADLAEGLEDAQRAAQDARTASSQARLTARIVVLLPAGGAALVEIAAPGTLLTMLSDPAALLLVAGAAALAAVALVAVRRIARVGEG